jgi:hypothetical protein
MIDLSAMVIGLVDYEIFFITLVYCCLLLLVLYLGDKMTAWNRGGFIALCFIVLALYDIIAVLRYPDSTIKAAWLVTSILILKPTLIWRTLPLFIAFGISTQINKLYHHHEAIFANFQYLTLVSYVTMSSIIVTMLLRQIYDNIALENLKYVDVMTYSDYASIILDKDVSCNPTDIGFDLCYHKVEIESLAGNISHQGKRDKFANFIITSPNNVKDNKQSTEKTNK